MQVWSQVIEPVIQVWNINQTHLILPIFLLIPVLFCGKYKLPDGWPVVSSVVLFYISSEARTGMRKMRCLAPPREEYLLQFHTLDILSASP